jgi:hypothetical protein
LIGLVVDRWVYAPARQDNLWQRFLRGMGVVMPLCGLAVVAATLFGWGPFRATPHFLLAAAFLAASAILAALAFWASAPGAAARQVAGVLSVTVFLGLGTAGVYRNVLAGLGEPIAENLAALKQRLPADVRLVSIGRVDSNFLFYYGEPIRLIEPGQLAAAQGEPWTYFCRQGESPHSACDFPHEDLAAISCKGIRSEKSGLTVAVGRRLPAQGQVAERPGSSGYR